LKKSLIASLLPALLLTALLQGCGGSSSNKPVAIVDPVEYTFSLKAELTNDCGVASAFTDIELLLQDDTWQTLSVHQTDETGVISFVTTSEFINYTLVAKDQKDSDSEGLNVVSFYQANSATPSTYQAQFDESLDNSTCECITNNLELSHRPFSTQTSVTSSLDYVSWSAVESDDTTTLFEGVEVCRIIDGAWPTHSFSVTGLDSNEAVIGSAGFIDNFQSDDTMNWSLAAFDVADEIELVIPHQAFTTNQLIGNTIHFSELIKEDAETLFVFDTHSNISEVFYQSQASVTFAESSSIFGSAVIKTHHQLISTKAEDSFMAKAEEESPAIDDRFFSEIEDNGSYDYSAVSGFPIAVIAFTFTAFDPVTNLLIPAKWTFYGPRRGDLAISGPLTGYENIITLETDKKTTEVHLIQSTMANNYQDYIQYYQSGNTVENALNASNDFVKALKQIEISISLN